MPGVRVFSPLYATNGATPTNGKWSAAAAPVDTVVDEVLPVGGGWRVVAAVDKRAGNGVPQEEMT